MTDVNIPFWSWSIIFFEKNYFGLEKVIFEHFFGLWCKKKRNFKDFQKIMISAKKALFFAKMQKMRNVLVLSSQIIFLWKYRFWWLYHVFCSMYTCIFIKIAFPRKLSFVDAGDWWRDFDTIFITTWTKKWIRSEFWGS